jgi:MFS family permease
MQDPGTVRAAPDSAPPARPSADRPPPPVPPGPPIAPGGLRARVLASLEARGTYPRWVLFAALAGMFATTFPVTILTISLSSMAAEFSTSETTIAWVISAPMLLSAVALPLLGKLGDMYGHRRIFLLGFLGATIVAALTATAGSVFTLIGYRTLAAVLGGATQPTSMALIMGVYEPERRVRAMGWWSMTTAAAPALGLIAGGPLVEWLGWRVVFVLQAVLSALALGLAALVLRETPGQRVRFDLAGATTLAVAVAGFMFAVGQIRDLGLASPWIGGALALSFVAGGLFVRIERATAAPLLPLAFFQERRFTAPIVSNAFMSSAYMGAFVMAPFVLLDVFEFSITTTSAIMLMRTLSLTLSSPVGGSLGLRIGERGAAATGCAVLTVGLAAMAWAVGAHSLIGVGTALVLQGVGHGLAVPSLTSTISNAVPEQDLGIASAANRLTAQAGASFGITLLALVYGGAATESALAVAFLAGAGLSALSFAAAVAMPVLHPAPGSHETDAGRIDGDGRASSTGGQSPRPSPSSQ